MFFYISTQNETGEFLTKLKKTSNSFKKWPLNPWWISNKTNFEVGNITMLLLSFFQLSYKNNLITFFRDSALKNSRDKH